MTTEDQAAIDKWLGAMKESQPDDTLALLFYNRDGKVTMQYAMKEFDLHNLPQVMELATGAIGELYDKGVPDAPDAE